MKTLCKSVSLILILVLVFSLVPGAVFAAEEDVPEEAVTVTPRVAYELCPSCGGQLRVANVPSHYVGLQMCYNCPFYPTTPHEHQIYASYTDYYCSNCGYSDRANYKVVREICPV